MDGPNLCKLSNTDKRNCKIELVALVKFKKYVLYIIKW